jgi:Transmembrane secretion effector
VRIVSALAGAGNFAVIGQCPHRPPTFFGVVSSAQGAGAIAGGIIMSPLLRRIGPARLTGLALAGFAVGSVSYLSGSAVLVLAVITTIGACAVYLLARPAPEPPAEAQPMTRRTAGPASRP